ncbi:MULTISPECIES: relaxase/mobilization nuclease domain-containing protein [Nostoc]|uniref:Relaxase/mobilization nuclease domain-containing protein n=1 Tax=Nostoc paludosum FACHB-159 TaxID=2692908 RepID=A0ABR8KJD3_9NOSO|nr:MULTISPECIES: relaxase/mobilization nuclease domain-containing protein [Nostoc]MBD2682593.1 relaxase/mobilization nuclease domain-containing protein [Nostoc sp. FACHB-857]MBD2738911.1 relaxase/mobilization nuclease domain-containing protein [Nostoc paludosum FACHB-159]
MIGNITKGNGFYGCVAYVLGKTSARLINTNMAGETPAQLAWEFRSFANKNQRVKKPVLHLSFSPAPGDRTLDDWELCQIAEDLREGLKLSNNQFILVQHNDAEFDGQVRPHAHMVINRVSYDGECNDDYLDYYRTEKILRQIEKNYDLIIQPSSWEVDKKKAYPKHVQQAEEFGTQNIVEQLQKQIEQAAVDNPAMPVFVARLLKENIQVDCKFTRTDKLKGISYCLDGQPFKGGDLGKLYTHVGIREHLKVSYQEEYRYPIESLIESYKRGRTIDDKRINYLENWIEWNFKQDSSSDGASEKTATIEVLSTQYNSTANLEPALEEVPTIANEPFAKKQTVVISPPSSPTTVETTQNQEFKEVPALITVRDDNGILLGVAAEPSALSQEKPTEQQPDIAEQIARMREIAPIVAEYLLVLNSTAFKGNRYSATIENNQLTLIRNSDGIQVMKAFYNSEEWQPIEPPQLGDEDVTQLQKLIPVIQQLKNKHQEVSLPEI